MNEQIEIKHLAPYLPYGVKILRPDGKTLLQLIGIENNLLIFREPNRDNVSYGDITKNKLALRPMSDLTKEVYQNEILIRWGGGLSDRAKAQWLKEVTDEMLYSAFNSIRYDFVEFMLEHHLDVFNLIPQNLAIDINSLNK